MGSAYQIIIHTEERFGFLKCNSLNLKTRNPESRSENWGRRPTDDLPPRIILSESVWERTWATIYNCKSSLDAHNILASCEVSSHCISRSVSRNESIEGKYLAQLQMDDSAPLDRDLASLKVTLDQRIPENSPGIVPILSLMSRVGSKTLEALCTIKLSNQLLVSTVSPLLLRLGRRGKLQETARHIRASTILPAVIKWERSITGR